jgi:hypothetical protein
MSELQESKFMDKLISKKGHLIHKFCAEDATGLMACYFVLLEPHRQTAFNKALKSGCDTINFEDYGRVIASCYGNQPTDLVKNLLKEKYGFDI